MFCSSHIWQCVPFSQQPLQLHLFRRPSPTALNSLLRVSHRCSTETLLQIALPASSLLTSSFLPRKQNAPERHFCRSCRLVSPLRPRSPLLPRGCIQWHSLFQIAETRAISLARNVSGAGEASMSFVGESKRRGRWRRSQPAEQVVRTA